MPRMRLFRTLGIDFGASVLKLSLIHIYWRRWCGITRADRITNEEIRRRMEVERSVIDYIEERRLVWYGHAVSYTHLDVYKRQVYKLGVYTYSLIIRLKCQSRISIT